MNVSVYPMVHKIIEYLHSQCNIDRMQNVNAKTRKNSTVNAFSLRKISYGKLQTSHFSYAAHTWKIKHEKIQTLKIFIYHPPNKERFLHKERNPKRRFHFVQNIPMHFQLHFASFFFPDFCMHMT